MRLRGRFFTLRIVVFSAAVGTLLTASLCFADWTPPSGTPLTSSTEGEQLHRSLLEPQPQQFCKTAYVEYKGIKLKTLALDEDGHCIVDEKAYLNARRYWESRQQKDEQNSIKIVDTTAPRSEHNSKSIYGPYIRNKKTSKEAELADELTDKVSKDVDAYKKEIIQ